MAESAAERGGGSGIQVILVRHGDDSPRIELDPPLSSLGRAQAEALACQLAGHCFDALYTSPRCRAVETAAILGARLGLEPLVVPGLREVPAGLPALGAFVRLALFARQWRGSRRLVVITHGGVVRFLLLWLEGWQRLPWLWQQPPCCRPFLCDLGRHRPGFGGPLALLFLGLALGLVLAPGPWPGLATLGSYLLALLVYGLACRLASQGRAGLVVAAILILALVATPLAFGPSLLQNRKVTAFNAWAYDLGTHLPAFLPAAPHPNGVAGVLAVAYGLAAGAALYASGRQRRLGAVGVMLLAVPLALTASRAGWLAGIGATCTLALRHGRRLALATLIACTLAVSSLVALAGYPRPGQPALTSLESLALRSEQWQRTCALLCERPLSGLGLGRFPYAYAAAAARYGWRPCKTPNNTLLQLWADAGVLGLIALAWMAARARWTLSALAARPLDAQGWLAAGLTAGLVALALHGLLETNTVFAWSHAGAYGHLASPLPFALLGLLAGARRRASPGS